MVLVTDYQHFQTINQRNTAKELANLLHSKPLKTIEVREQSVTGLSEASVRQKQTTTAAVVPMGGSLGKRRGSRPIDPCLFTLAARSAGREAAGSPATG